MPIDRREFMKTGAALAALKTLSPRAAFGAAADMPAGAVRTLGRMAWGAGTWYRPYQSKVAHEPEAATWVQIDLGSTRAVESVRLYPAFTPGDVYAKGYGFPSRFRIEVSNDASFAKPTLLADQSGADFAEPHDEITEFAGGQATGRYVRLTATKLRPAQDGVWYKLALTKIDVVSGGKDVAVSCPVTADTELGNPKDLAQIV
ncbi:MAG: discoidin domain-containing protein, partial [Bryobacteraceae bacterium]|nr:discoidin domain-containing protein [Bryobacteraceae bacterium]